MHPRGKSGSVLLLAWACLLLSASVAAADNAVPADAGQLLKHADGIRSANQEEFTRELKQLDAESAKLTPSQQMYLRYLKAWQLGYSGDYAAEIPQLESIISESQDVNLRFRAGITVVNSLEIASRNEESFSRLNQLLDLLPRISDPEARQQGLLVASQLYNQVGQYELAITYADKMIAENWAGKGICKGGEIRLNALYKAGKSRAFADEFQHGIDACVQAGEPIWANLARYLVANSYVAQKKYPEAIKLLNENYDEVRRTRYPALIATFDATLAQAYLQTGDSQQAQQYALHAISSGILKEFTEAQINAYQVLYQLALKQGDYQSAFAYHVKFAAADKGYLNDTSARALAFQMVRQQVQQKKQQVDALNKENQVLQLKQQVSVKNAEAGRLLLLLLLTVLGSIALYAYRTKRAQLKFMNLARRDGLTGIFNRQHFIEASEDILAYAAKSVRDASVIVIDLDHFKNVNDTHGHAAGDMVLKSAVAACQGQLRSVDVFGRLGGEEFGILLPDCVPERAADIAEQMRKAIAELCDAKDNGIDFPVNASFGVSAARWSGYNLRQLLAHADSALYRAKREGRNRVAIHDDKGETAESLPSGLLDRRRG